MNHFKMHRLTIQPPSSPICAFAQTQKQQQEKYFHISFLNKVLVMTYLVSGKTESCLSQSQVNLCLGAAEDVYQ